MKTMKVEISLHASKLKNVAGAFKGTSDPFAVVTNVSTARGAKASVIGKTEVIKNTLSPNWTKSVIVDYQLGSQLKVAVSIFDEVKKNDNKSMGSAVFDIAEILGARGNTKAKKVKGSGTIFIHAKKLEGQGTLRLGMKGIKLKNVEGLFGKSDPFFELSRNVNSAGGLTWDNVFRSATVKNNLNPVWNESVVELSSLCDGDLDKPVRITVYDFESKGDHVLMGQFDSSVNGLVEAAQRNNQIKLQRKGKDTGTIVVTKAETYGTKDDLTQRMASASVSQPVAATAFVAPTTQKPSFLDYVSGGCELNVSVAIDFTGSNGDPRKPGTLHYLHKDGQKNDYEKAISSIVGVLEYYDHDGSYPVWGFGAKYGGEVRHCFQCGPTQEVDGVDGIINAYHQTFRSGLIMSGPTDITEVLQTAAAQANSAHEEAMKRGKQKYTIVLIVTDGAVSDINATAAMLDQISDSPLSVVIVGVGNADFSGMQFLDDASKPGKRDIAQFVQFNRHCSSSENLSSETLHEIPDQLVGYFQSKGISPMQPVQVSDDEIVVGDEEEEIDLSLDFGGGEDEEIAVTWDGAGTSSGGW